MLTTMLIIIPSKDSSLSLWFDGKIVISKVKYYFNPLRCRPPASLNSILSWPSIIRVQQSNQAANQHIIHRKNGSKTTIKDRYCCDQSLSQSHSLAGWLDGCLFELSLESQRRRHGVQTTLQQCTGPVTR